MVLASAPVASVIRLAARPVGAARAKVMPMPAKAWVMQRMMVVLPVPGPPVMIMTPASRARVTASRWLSDRVSPSSRSYWLTSQKGLATGGSESCISFWAMLDSMRAI